MPLGVILGAFAVAGLAAAQLHGGAGGVRAWLPYLLVAGITLGGLAYASKGTVEVRQGLLIVPGARAPLTAFGTPEILEGEVLRRWLGPQADPDAWVAVRPWQRRAVRLPVVDPEDETPYWLVGVRDPDALARAVTLA